MVNDSKGLKPVICIVNPDDRYYIKQNRVANLLPYCVTPYEVEILKNEGVKFPEDKLHEGVILMYDHQLGRYIYRMPEDEDRMIKERISNLNTLLSYLGAKKCTTKFHSSQEIEHSTKVNVDVDVQAPISSIDSQLGVNVGYDSQDNNSNQTDVFSQNEWPGNYNEDAYAFGCKLAEDSGLTEDKEILSLLQERHPTHPNPNKIKQYRIELRSESRKQLDVAVGIKLGLEKLGLPLLKSKVDVNVKTSDYAQKHSVLDFTVEFGDFIPKGKPEKVEFFEEKKDEIASDNSTKKIITIAVGAVIVGATIAVAIMKLM